jgi:hypothetical protein
VRNTAPPVADRLPAPERLDELRAWGNREAKRVKELEAENADLRAERDALRDETEPLRRQAALWRAGIKPGAAANLFLDRLPNDVDLDDVEAVRQACAEITSAVLGARDQLAEATT